MSRGCGRLSVECTLNFVQCECEDMYRSPDCGTQCTSYECTAPIGLLLLPVVFTTRFNPEQIGDSPNIYFTKIGLEARMSVRVGAVRVERQTGFHNTVEAGPSTHVHSHY